MARFSLITYMFLFVISCLHGAPIKHISHITSDENTHSKIISREGCHDNCSFVITESSLFDAQQDLAEFMNKQKSMLVYVNIDPHSNLTLSPVNDQQKQNQIREWQWIMSTNSWYINLPIDLDYASFHVTYSGESRIRLKIEGIESNCCSINDASIENVRNLLWSDLFTNRSGSFLCNRFFDNQEWKSTFYAFTTVWIGYDLLCVAPTIDKSYQEKSHAAASVLTPLFCFFIALFHPLTNKIIENPYINRKLKEVKKSEGEMELYDYMKGDKPFGYKRFVLKFFFSEKNAKFIPAIKLNIMYFIIYSIFNTVPLMLEHYHDKEELEDFYSIYKLGLPIFHYWKAEGFCYKYQILITNLVLLPLVSYANFWYFIQFSESTDFLIFLKFPTVVNMSKTENNVWRCNSWTLSEDIDKIIKNLKTISNEKRINKRRQRKIKRKTYYVPKRTDITCDEPDTLNEFVNSSYSKFIKRFTLLFSLVFWKYIFDLSTEISYDSKSKSNAGNKKPGNCITRCLVCCVGFFTLLPINTILIIITCAFPGLWFIMFPFLDRIKKCLSIPNKEYQKCKQNNLTTTTTNTKINDSEHTESTTEGYDSTTVSEVKPDKSEDRESVTGIDDAIRMRDGKLNQSGYGESITSNKDSTMVKEAKQNQSEDSESIAREHDSTTGRQETSNKYKDTESIIENNCIKFVYIIVFLFNFANQIIKCLFCNITPIISIAYLIICLFFHIACIFFLYHQFSVIVLILRSVVYILFIAMTNYDHLLRIFIVVTSCFAYLGVFIAKFIDRYSAILKIIFDEFEENIYEEQKSPHIPNSEECTKVEKKVVATSILEDKEEKEKKEETVCIPEECFDYVIDHCYAVREHFFHVLFKIAITIMFFTLSLAVLLQSNVFDSTAKLTNIIDFVFIVVTPSVLFKFFDKDEQVIMHDHERDIRQRTNEYYEQQEEESKEDTEEKIAFENSIYMDCNSYFLLDDTVPLLKNR